MSQPPWKGRNRFWNICIDTPTGQWSGISFLSLHAISGLLMSICYLLTSCSATMQRMEPMLQHLHIDKPTRECVVSLVLVSLWIHCVEDKLYCDRNFMQMGIVGSLGYAGWYWDRNAFLRWGRDCKCHIALCNKHFIYSVTCSSDAFYNHFWWFSSNIISYKLLVEFIFIPLIC